MPDGIKWGFALALVAGAVGAFYFYADQSLLLRVIAVLVAVGIASVIALQTEKGRAAWGVARDARAEVRKVVWPTRKETLQTTMVVIAMVSVIAVILWLLDGLLAYAMRQLLGTGDG